MQQSARGTAYWRWGPFLNVSSSCTCSDSPQRRQAGLSAPLSSPVLAVVFTAVPGRGFLMPMQCDACRRARNRPRPRKGHVGDPSRARQALGPRAPRWILPTTADPPSCDSTLAGNTDSTRIRARIICSRTPIRARIIPTETRDVVRCSSLAHGLPVSPPLLHPPPSGLGVGLEWGGCPPGCVGNGQTMVVSRLRC